MRHLAALLALMVLFIFSTTQVPAATPVASAAVTSGTFLPTAEYQLGARIKAEHYRACGRPIYRSTLLLSAARWRAKDMVVRNYYSHAIPPLGLRVWSYFPRWGITYRYAGEDISSAPAPWYRANIVDWAWDGWMSSASHRALIRDCRMTRLAVGIYRGSNGERRVAAEFIKPR